MKTLTFAAALTVGLAGLGSAVVYAADAPAAPGAVTTTPPPAAFTDSTAAGLAGTKRVAISSVIVAFQASTGEQKGGGGIKVPIFGGPRTSVQSVLAMPEMDGALQEKIAQQIYLDLQARLTESGYELVPEAQVKSATNYQALLKQSGYANHSQFANAVGDVMLVAPPSLQPYMQAQIELGLFQNPGSTYMSWVGGGFGAKSATAGGPSGKMQADAWKIPGIEVALAKELNANVVKAYYVVTLGSTTARKEVNFTSTKVDVIGLFGVTEQTRDVKQVVGTSTSFAQLGLLADQTHIAFRTPSGNAKFQRVSMGKPVPPKDGDVVLRIAEPIYGGTDWFTLQQEEWKRAGGFFSAQKRGDINLLTVVRINNAPGYAMDTLRMAWLANASMLKLVPAR